MDEQPVTGSRAFRVSYVSRKSTASSNAWSQQEVRQLRELAEAGLPLESIATQLGRTRSAIRNKAGFHAISLRRRDRRQI